MASIYLPLWAALGLIALVLYLIHQHEQKNRRKTAVKRAIAIRGDLSDVAERVLVEGSAEDVERVAEQVQQARDAVLDAVTDPETGLTVSWDEADLYTAHADELTARLDARRDELDAALPTDQLDDSPKLTFAEWSLRHRSEL